MQPCDLQSYDRVIVAFSGGKDSSACALHLLELGVPRERIELWHHLVDGREGSHLFDWRCTEPFIQAFGEALGLRVLFSWRIGGFEWELLKDGVPSQGVAWEEQDYRDGSIIVRNAGGDRAKPATRMCFPAVAADLRSRWCSPHLKIDVMDRALSNDLRFRQGRTLVVTGERAEESANRARYEEFEPHRSDNRGGARIRRYIDQWRPVHKWSETEVWGIHERWRVQPHPAYRLGWGRLSCASCIFGSPNQWASFKAIYPERFEALARLEEYFVERWSHACKGCGAPLARESPRCPVCGAVRFRGTLYRDETLRHRAERGVPYAACRNGRLVELAASDRYYDRIIVAPGEWHLPAGAFGESAGPV